MQTLKRKCQMEIHLFSVQILHFGRKPIRFKSKPYTHEFKKTRPLNMLQINRRKIFIESSTVPNSHAR